MIDEQVTAIQRLREEVIELRAERDSLTGTRARYVSVIDELKRVTVECDALRKVYEATEVFVDTPRLATESVLRDAVTAFRALAVQP